MPYGGGFAPPSWRGAAGSLLWGPCTGPEQPYMCMRISIPRCVHCCVSALGAVSPDFCWDRRGRSMQSGCLSRCPGAARTALRAVVQPIILLLPSLAHAQVGDGLLCAPLLKRLRREGDGNTVRPLTLRVWSCLVTYKSYLNS